MNNLVVGNLADLNAVTGVLSRLTHKFPDFRPGGPTWSFANFTSKELPDPARLGTIEMRRAWVTGRLTAKIESIRRLLEPIAQGLLATPAPLVCDIAIGFEEKASKQSKRAFDTIRWRFGDGKHRFGYSANGSRINTDRPYAKTVFRELIDRLRLPMSIIEKPAGFVLKHTAEGSVDIPRAGGLDNENPSAFYCDISHLTSANISVLLQSALHLCSSGKLIEFDWSVRTSPPYAGRNPDDTTESPLVFAFLTTAGLPADSYDLQLEPRLRTLDELEVLRLHMGAKDTVLLPAGAFQFGEQAFANVEVRAGKQGYSLEICSRLPLPLGFKESLA